MLKGIPSILSPTLLKILMEMGHGDEIVIADGNFPAETLGQRVVRLDGHGVPEILEAIIQFMPLDTAVDAAVTMMEVGGNYDFVPEIWAEYKQILQSAHGNNTIEHIDRFDFYDKTKKAYAVVATGEKAIYANILLKKGVV